ncbi:MAG: S-adenosylmethionine decarboxylase [Vicinamibacteria bacterium]
MSGCDALAALSPDDIIGCFTAALVNAGANVVCASSHVFPGAGLTAVVILRESHAVVHTWPETGTVNLDIFSCTSRLKAMDAVDEMSRVLRAGRVSVQATPRADGRQAQDTPQGE